MSHSNVAAPCGVFDIDLQDPILHPGYVGLPSLPSGREIIPVYDPDRIAGIPPPSVKGGRVKYSIWKKYIPDMLVDNSHGAMSFQEAVPNFINRSRVSPISILCYLSEDIMLSIFFTALGDFGVQPYEYDRIRHILRQINKELRGIIVRSRSRGRTYIDFSTYMPYIRAAVRRSQNTPLFIILDFTNPKFAINNHWDREDVVSFIDVIFTVLDGCWDRCSSLSIRSSYGFATEALYEHIHLLRSTSMTRLDVVFRSLGFRLDARPPLFDNFGRTSSLALGGLTQLTLDGALPQ
ncbi:hypothetical protein B0H13DRAFT_2350498 [Mycena leptocephala]|nr:hypothetical protein B0H13DRAFT_2350498 [Mycena leptocephala]